jgi:GTPase SAR1 family protein
MVIGDKQAGKTLLINKIIQNDYTQPDYKYTPTRRYILFYEVSIFVNIY